MVKRICWTVMIVWGCMTGLSAQNHHKKFSPEKFEQELKQFITQEAKLTQDEAAKFFPVYNEMREKQRVLFNKQRKMGRVKPCDEAACQKAIQERDNNELEQKRLQQCYHNKFFNVLPASKVYDVIKAEDKFHRTMLRQWSHRQQQKDKKEEND